MYIAAPHRATLPAVAFVLLNGMTLSLSVHAEESVTEIVITGRQPVAAVIAPRYTLTREAIDQRNDRSLDDILDAVPNLSIRTGGQGVPRIDIRGLRTRQTLLLVDGVPFNSTWDGQFDPTLIPSAYIGSVRVTTGAPSELYGAGAMSVIDVQPRRGGTSLLEIAADAGLNEAHRVDLTLGGGAGSSDFLFSASRRYREAQRMPGGFVATPVENGQDRDNSDLERNNLFLNLGYDATTALRLGLTAAAGYGEYGIPASTINDAGDVFASTPTYERVDDQRSYVLQGSFSLDPGGRWDLRGWGYGNWLHQDENRYDDARMDSIDDVTVKGTYLISTATSVAGVKLRGDYAISEAIRLGVAAHRQYDSWHQQGVIRDQPVGSSSSGGGGGGGGGASKPAKYNLRALNQTAELTNSSLAAESEVDLPGRIGLIAGVGIHGQERVGADDSATTYSLGATVAATERLRFTASWSKRVRFPSIRQLYDATAGNVTLLPEVLRGVDLGARYGFNEAIELALAAFNYEVEDFIERDNLTNRFANIDSARLRGIELSARTRLWDRLQTHLSYGLLDTKDQSGSGRDEIQNEPRHKLALDLDYPFASRGGVHLKLVHSADQFYYSRRGALLKAKLPASTRVDLGLRWQPMSFPLSLTAGVENLFDEYSQDEYALPNPGRTFYLGFRWRR